MTTLMAQGPLERKVMPHVVGPWYAFPPAGLDQWEVTLSTMRLTINANSHQAAKRVAVGHWSACNAEPETFRRAIEARIAEKWRGGIKARRIVRHNVQDHRPCAGTEDQQTTRPIAQGSRGSQS